jgi:transcriptional regulator with XRE-family HTH domain
MKKQQPTGFGVRLKQLREAAGLTQEQLATRADMLEQGVREPVWSTVLDVNCLAFTDEVDAEAVTPKTKRGRSPRPRRGGPPKGTAT